VLQIGILKVLSSYPDGFATLAALNADLSILSASGREWSHRLQRLAARVPDLDIFGQRLVLRRENGWQMTEAGFALLRSIETPDKGLHRSQPDTARTCAMQAARPKATAGVGLETMAFGAARVSGR
jgi:hypothetical protein